MVTLQILVLSFLVRIQVAQLKRLSLRGSFFLYMVVVACLLHEGSLATTAKQDAHVLMQASAMYPCLSQRCCPHATVVSIVI